MAKKANNNLQDALFIIVFSVLIFFGALFVFTEVNKTEAPKEISVRNLENKINQKVNSRIRKLEGKKIFLKSKIKSTSNFDSTEGEIGLGTRSDNSSLDMQIFEQKDVDEFRPKKQSMYDEVMEEASFEDGNNIDQQKITDAYKERLIQRAREEGWEIELNDELEITKQVKLKK